MLCKPEGPIPANIMLVGEAPGFDEERLGLPFQGVSGQELNRMLQEAGISRSECFVTNVCRERPQGNDINHFIPKAKKDVKPNYTQFRDKKVAPCVVQGANLLAKEIQMVKPNIIIALGNTALWCLTGITGVSKWRGSMLNTTPDFGGTKCVPTYHPAAILRQWSDRAICINDLRRAALYRDGRPYPTPKWNFIVRPSFNQTWEVVRDLLGRLATEVIRLSFDLETRKGHIACAGLAWSLSDAISIPFMQRGSTAGYWPDYEEGQIVYWLYKVLTHPNARVIGQNLLYDAQYTYRHWHFVPRVEMDTMIAQHSCFSDMPKSLAFICSMYCKFYEYWKEDK